jgi:hypothetical protein
MVKPSLPAPLRLARPRTSGREKIMDAVEFRAKIKNGVIEIPKEYRDRLPEGVHVILLAERPSADMIDRLLEQPLKLAGFTPLTRDEAHERE